MAVNLSLTTCSVNLQELCDGHAKRTAAQYVKEWQYGAPPHCRSDLAPSPGANQQCHVCCRSALEEDPTVDAPVHSDRLAVPLSWW